MTYSTVANVSTKAVLEVCARRGVEADSLLSAARIDAVQVAKPEGRIPVEQVCALWAEAQRLTGDEALALRASKLLPFGANGVIDYIGITSRTAGEALTRVSRYHRLLNGAVEYSLRPYKGRALLELHSLSDPNPLSGLYVEYLLANAVLRLRMMTGRNLIPLEVNFTHVAPRGISEYHKLFQAAVKFNRPANRVVFDKRDMDAPQPHADPLLCEVLEHHALGLLKVRSEDDELLVALTTDLRESLRGGTVGIETAARRMAMSRRSLQRRLKEQGTTYREVLDSVRRDLAFKLIRDQGREPGQVAFLLGFSELSSFYRAFKRWTGKSTQEFLRASSPRVISIGHSSPTMPSRCGPGGLLR
jgi:AraC-like DNA-binding protein